ncbi:MULTISPECIES: HlyD family secretion protein [unclassified Hahella]|uniref:HlyD family secretion protein n=1 Tax=unclassified Hahella TaxID=2624107 RepID=UPI001C1ECCD2|nr:MULTISPECIES: HlyD family secretion protein [unclassified Hahella]MBU6953404.1 HlyD family secretion protein [Hahella sp. HN01]MDG9669310.1 HlyD family secretion protein [Hahella sp. CR1]
MTPDQKFAQWIKYSCIAFVLVFAYFLIADIAMPLTPQAMATRIVTKVAPRISGPITAVYVENNQPVRKGDILFDIDPEPFKIAVEQAQLNLERVKQNNAQLDASIAAAKADVEAASATLSQKNREALRLKTLFQRNVVSQQQLDKAESDATTAQAKLTSVKAHLKELEVSRGELSDANLTIRTAETQLKQAQLNLSYTRIKAEEDGVITNLQLEAGAYAVAGAPLVALVSDNLDVIADFREKSLRNFDLNNEALVAFDGKPGQVFQARVSSLDAGVSAGQFDADGRLATPTQSNRWVRDAQRMRLHLQLDAADAQQLPSGARATVQLLPDGAIFSTFAKAQIRFLSLLHYIY